jgi:hypothetical protein
MLEAIPAEEVDVSNRSARAAVVLFVKGGAASGA